MTEIPAVGPALLNLSRAARLVLVAVGVMALIGAGMAWVVGVTSGGLDVYEACGDETRTVVRDEWPPVHVTCIYSGGETRDLVPALLNPAGGFLTIAGVGVLGVVYANVLADAWRRPT